MHTWVILYIRVPARMFFHTGPCYLGGPKKGSWFRELDIQTYGQTAGGRTCRHTDKRTGKQVGRHSFDSVCLAELEL